MVGLLLARLQELGTYDESLIVVTADHGAAFEMGEPLRGVSAANADSVLWVPLLVKAPGPDHRPHRRPARPHHRRPSHDGGRSWTSTCPRRSTGCRSWEPEPGPGPDERRVYDWGFNRLEPNADGYSLIDGTTRASTTCWPSRRPGEGDDPDLRFYRWGRHGDLVGRRGRGLPVRPRGGT